jgi:hypothetical protein
VEALKALMRIYSYVFHGLLALVLVLLAAAALAAGVDKLQLGMLPWTGMTLIYMLLLGGLMGILSVILAVRGKLRFLFLLWSVVVAVMTIKGYIFSPYRFPTPGWGNAKYLIPGSLLAILGAWFQFRQQPARAKRF